MNMHSTIARPTAGRRRWEEVVTRLKAAAKELDKYDEEMWWPTSNEIARRAGSRPELEFTAVAKSGQVVVHRIMPRELDEWADSEIWGKYAAPIRDAWREWEARNEEAEKALGWQVIEKRSDDLVERWRRARDIMVRTPAPDAAAMAEKAVYLLDSDSAPDDCWPFLLADAKRFSTQASMDRSEAIG